MGSSVSRSNPFLAAIEDEHELNKDMAKRTEEDAVFNASQRRRQGDKLLNEQKSAYGASGVEISGSALEQVKNDAVDAEREALNIIYSGKLKSAEMKARSSLQKTNAYLSLGKDTGKLLLKGT